MVDRTSANHKNNVKITVMVADEKRVISRAAEFRQPKKKSISSARLTINPIPRKLAKKENPFVGRFEKSGGWG